MEWVSQLRGTVVGVDTAPFIYFMEDHPKYRPVLVPFSEVLDRGEFSAVTSVLTLCEVLPHPFRKGALGLAENYRRILLRAAHLATLNVTPEIAEDTARLRAKHNLRTPDAVQIAAALREGATSFVTNDTDLPTLPGLRIIVLDNLLDQ
ncbi:MAG TPA: PIN domain-containing protein [Planctomycetota bacterium]|nr:PIN domain-containing protein [Planctomycetota bacterium]HRR80440.1 PIN domain-containing protein [Planctomycetota bacterium]HRT96628.1 PIN domain-containing protein [Planctomycetota bacterium]